MLACWFALDKGTLKRAAATETDPPESRDLTPAKQPCLDPRPFLRCVKYYFSKSFLMDDSVFNAKLSNDRVYFGFQNLHTYRLVQYLIFCS